MIGPVPVNVGFFGRIRLDASFVFGYDTSGIRKALTAPPASTCSTASSPST